jgi:hypothetical protein
MAMKLRLASLLASLVTLASVATVSADPVPVGAICRQGVCVTGDEARKRIEVEAAKGVVFDPAVVAAAEALPTATYVTGPNPWSLPNANKTGAIRCAGQPTDVGVDLLCGKPNEGPSLSLVRVGDRDFMLTREGIEFGVARSAPNAGGGDDAMIVVKVWAAGTDGAPVFGSEFDGNMTTIFSWDSAAGNYTMDWAGLERGQSAWEFVSRGL